MTAIIMAGKHPLQLLQFTIVGRGDNALEEGIATFNVKNNKRILQRFSN